MPLYIRFPKRLSLPDKTDLVVLSQDADPKVEDPARIVVGLGDRRLVGRSDDDARDLTVFVSGFLTNVPGPLQSGCGTAAAQALATLYAKHETQILPQLDGAFSFVILDWQRATIIVGRDKLGIARAYLSRHGDTIVFADCLADLLRAAPGPFEVDVDSIYAFLMIGWVPTPHSMMRGIEKLRPGTFIENRAGALTETEYYDVPHASTIIHRPRPALCRQIVEHLDRAVDRGQSIGGRWGSFLSGGVDSSSVVSSLARTYGGGFPTYFGGFSPHLNRYLPNPEEPALSKLVAERFQTCHNMLWLGSEAVETMPEIIAAIEEPVCDGGCIVIGEIMKAARSETDGLMTGIGGDFLFTGERRHMVLNLLRYLRLVPDAALQAVRYLAGQSFLARQVRISQIHFDITRLMAVRALDQESMYVGFFRQAEAPELNDLFVPEARAKLSRSPLYEIHDCFTRAAELDPISRFLYLDLKMHTPDHCVREVEMLGRYFGVTAYHPFLDAEFVDFAMTVPATEKISGLTLKVPLKRAMRGRVPDAVLHRKKGGLGSPIRWWVTRPDGLVGRTLSRTNVQRRGMFSYDALARLRTATAEGSSDYTKLLWSLFTLELWMQRFIDA